MRNIFSRSAAILLFCLLLIPILITVLLILGFDGRPILFKQVRIGRSFKKFYIYKFRTMAHESKKDGITFSGDGRISTLGRILRKYKIDELPQLLNIIRGEMVFVGPRPEIEKYTIKYNFSFMENSSPGVTDISSIIFRDEESILSQLQDSVQDPYELVLDQKIKLARFYSLIKDPILDSYLILLTLISVVSPHMGRTLGLKIIMSRSIELKEEIQSFLRILHVNEKY
jgi:lipopolysaccharide/colanic/teichoic acid biosynthesis glycosyltransferase